MTGLASRAQLRASFWRYALVTVPAVLLLGSLSGQLSNSGYGNAWFDALEKPGFMPPGWAFGAAWTALYVLLGIALALLLHARGAKGRGKAIGLFLVQLAINFAWSPVFFAFHETQLALAMIAAMVVITAVLVVLAWKIRPLVSLLLVPYLAWLCFAAALNFQIVALNPGADTLAPPGASADIEL